jgi:5-oxoprolinase (ATP-hydrolysing)
MRHRFDQQHQQIFIYCFLDFVLELMRLGVVLEDASPGIDNPPVEKATNSPADGKTNIVQGEVKPVTLEGWQKISKQGSQVPGPCIISEMDSNILILPGFYCEIDSIRDTLINALEQKPAIATTHTAESAKELVRSTPFISTSISSTLTSISRRDEQNDAAMQHVSSDSGATR